MIRLNKKVTVNPIFTADDWQLYTLNHQHESDEAARELNETLRKSVFYGLNKVQVELAVWRTMEAYAEVGATDSEPGRFLNLILEDIFGE